MAVLSARALLGLLAAGVVVVTAEATAWAEVRSGETPVATTSGGDHSMRPGRSRPSPSPVWPYLPSAIEQKGASDLSASLVPPSPPNPSPQPVLALSAPDVAWLASLKLPDLPVRIDARVLEYLRFYKDSERGRALAREWTYRSGRFVPAIQARLTEAGLPRDLVWLSMVESGHDPSIRSRAGALGLWQFMRGTAHLYGLEVDRWVDERHDPELSTRAALRFLRDLRERFGSWELAMAAYNMGPGGLGRAIKKYNTNDYWQLSRFEAAIPWETTLYVPKIVATALVMNNRQAFGLDDVATAAPEARDTITVGPGRTLAEVAYAAGVPVAELLRLNPQLIARRAPPANRGLHGWRLHLPPGKGAAVRERLAPASAGVAATSAVAAVASTARVPSPAVAEAAVAEAAVAEAAVAEAAVAEVEPAEQALVAPGGARAVVVPARRFHYTTRRPIFYEVVERDTLAAVSTRFRVTESELLLWNSLDRAARLQAGQVLQLFVPATQSLAGVRHATPADVSVIEVGSPEFYAYFEGRAGRVRLVIPAKQGDTLTRIGGRYGIRPGSMERINQRSRREVLAAGEEVVVYVKPWRAAQIASAGIRAPASSTALQAPSRDPVQAPTQPKASAPGHTSTTAGTR